MKPIKFIQTHGEEVARHAVTYQPRADYRFYGCNQYNSMFYWSVTKEKNCVCLFELKNVIKQIDLINSLGGIETVILILLVNKTNYHINSMMKNLETALRIYSAIYPNIEYIKYWGEKQRGNLSRLADELELSRQRIHKIVAESRQLKRLTKTILYIEDCL